MKDQQKCRWSWYPNILCEARLGLPSLKIELEVAVNHSVLALSALPILVTLTMTWNSRV